MGDCGDDEVGIEGKKQKDGKTKISSGEGYPRKMRGERREAKKRVEGRERKKN